MSYLGLKTGGGEGGTLRMPPEMVWYILWQIDSGRADWPALFICWQEEGAGSQGLQKRMITHGAQVDAVQSSVSS